MDNENNVRTLDFGRDDTPALMPEDIFEGGAPGDFTAEDLAAAEPQYTDTVVTGDFGPVEESEPLTAVTLMQSRPFFYIQIPSLGIEAPVDVETATSLFDTLGEAINGL